MCPTKRTLGSVCTTAIGIPSKPLVPTHGNPPRKIQKPRQAIKKKKTRQPRKPMKPYKMPRNTHTSSDTRKGVYHSTPGAGLTEIAPGVPEVHVGAQPCVARKHRGATHRTGEEGEQRRGLEGIRTKHNQRNGLQGIYTSYTPGITSSHGVAWGRVRTDTKQARRPRKRVIK